MPRERKTCATASGVVPNSSNMQRVPGRRNETTLVECDRIAARIVPARTGIAKFGGGSFLFSGRTFREGQGSARGYGGCVRRAYGPARSIRYSAGVFKTTLRVARRPSGPRKQCQMNPVWDLFTRFS